LIFSPQDLRNAFTLMAMAEFEASAKVGSVPALVASKPYDVSGTEIMGSGHEEIERLLSSSR
jgi:hypothetical protein